MEKPRRRPAFLFLMRVLLEKYQILRERIQWLLMATKRDSIFPTINPRG
jgi:hypothetical protein